MMNVDLLIQGAAVYDGSGEEPKVADVAVKAGVIVGVGKSLPVTATETLNADGLALMPGIIDSHTHFDAPWA